MPDWGQGAEVKEVRCRASSYHNTKGGKWACEIIYREGDSFFQSPEYHKTTKNVDFAVAKPGNIEVQVKEPREREFTLHPKKGTILCKIGYVRDEGSRRLRLFCE